MEVFIQKIAAVVRVNLEWVTQKRLYQVCSYTEFILYKYLVSHLLEQVKMLFCVHSHSVDLLLERKRISCVVKITLYFHNGIYSRLGTPLNVLIASFLKVNKVARCYIKIIFIGFLQELISCWISIWTAKPISTASVTLCHFRYYRS